VRKLLRLEELKERMFFICGESITALDRVKGSLIW
jgi:hypothetical protein